MSHLTKSSKFSRKLRDTVLYTPKPLSHKELVKINSDESLAYYRNKHPDRNTPGYDPEFQALKDELSYYKIHKLETPEELKERIKQHHVKSIRKSRKGGKRKSKKSKKTQKNRKSIRNHKK